LHILALSATTFKNFKRCWQQIISDPDPGTTLLACKLTVQKSWKMSSVYRIYYLYIALVVCWTASDYTFIPPFGKPFMKKRYTILFNHKYCWCILLKLEINYFKAVTKNSYRSWSGVGSGVRAETSLKGRSGSDKNHSRSTTLFSNQNH